MKEVALKTADTSPDLVRLMRPRSIAIVGISPERTSPGAGVLDNLERFGYGGEIHLVSRTRTEVKGRPCVATIDSLPMEVDVALLLIPRSAIEEAVAACARRRIGALVIFAAGFAEVGGEWKAAQERIAAVARHAGIALCGPNCLGINNYVQGIPLTFSSQPLYKAAASGGLAVIAQSGGLATVLRAALQAKGLSVSYTVSTGNEAVLGLEDYVEYLQRDEATSVIVAFAEQIRQPQRFLALARRGVSLGKPMVLLHPGRSAAARASAQSHTGALAGDHALMETLASHNGVVMINSLEELIDVSELLARFPAAPSRGAAIVTDSGAFKGMALDVGEAEGLDLPEFSGAIAEKLKGEIPEFVDAVNPLDLTAQGITHLDLYERTVAPILQDDRIGSLLLAGIMTGHNEFSLKKGRAMLRALIGADKPVVFGLLGDDVAVPVEFIDEARAAGIPVHRSPERALRALARFTAYGRAVQKSRQRRTPEKIQASELPGQGALAEYVSKSYLAGCGVPVPAGKLARTLAEARAFAAENGFPVVLKLQSPALSHKTDAGAVILGLSDDASLAEAWVRLEKIAAATNLSIDGVLVEAMARPGVEMLVGGRRDPDWGPVLVVGLGGIWAEALKDIRLLPADLETAEIEAEIGKLKGARILGGMRGSGARDIAAVARIASRVGALLLARPEIREIDINPVTVYALGEGAIALDALIVAG